MKESNKNLIGLEISNLVRVCLNETLQSSDSLEQCKFALEVLPSYLLYAICLDPVFYLFNEKNIFFLINNFFKNDAISKLGCETATQLILLPLKTIQVAACDLVREKKNLKGHLLENRVFNSINMDCSLSILPKTNEFLQNCYPELDFTNSTEVINEHIASTKKLCLEDLKQISVGDKIKLCDNFQKAMECTYCDLDESTKDFFKSIYPNKKFTDEEMKKRMMPRYQKLRGRNITNLSKEEIQFKINNTFLGEKIIEASACESVVTTRVPFVALTKACFSIDSSYAINETNPVINDNFYECKESIESLTKNEKKVFCEKPIFFFRNMEKNQYFNSSLQAAKSVCEKHFNEEDGLQQTLDLIKSSNTTNNIANTSLEGISSPNISAIQADLLQMDEHYALRQEGSTGLINTNTAFERPTTECGKVAAIAAGASLIGLAWLGCFLWKKFRREPSQNIEACNGKYRTPEASNLLQLT